jgi:hypothetical protein
MSGTFTPPILDSPVWLPEIRVVIALFAFAEHGVTLKIRR